MIKEYKSFEEIDARLKVLKLRRKIDQESLKLRFNQAKVDLVPRSLLQGLGTTFTQSGTWKKMLLAFSIKKIVGMLRKSRQKEIKA